VGTRQLLILLEKIITDGHDNNSSDIDALLEQAELMAKTSLCPLGQSPVLPIKSAMRYFRNELEQTTNYSGGPLI
jgi:NADH-quinone oxidoreductase subunit F